MKKILFHLFFVAIVAGTILSDFYASHGYFYLSKPLIMVWIGVYFLFHSQSIDAVIVRMAIGAFIFSWIGDIFLMFSERGMVFFASGVFSFLIAQVFYIVLFLKTIQLSRKKYFLKKQPFWLIAYIAYGMLFAIILYSKLDNLLRIAVFIYIAAILAMSSMALNRLGNGHPVSFTLIFSGSLFFVISDSLIAVDRFIAPFSLAAPLILLTYIAAQYLIMRGILKQYE